MIFQPLCSSSQGNAYVLQDDCTAILIECGVTYKKLQQLSAFRVSGYDACLISHEHKDHSGCVKMVIKAGVPVYLSQGTARALELPEPLLDMCFEMEAGRKFQVGSMEILPFAVFHDAEEPLGFCIQSRIDNDVFVFAIDTVNIPYNFPGVNILAAECNFDPEKFAWLQENVIEGEDLDSIQKRQMRKRIIRTMNTHMSIDKLIECLGHIDLSQCREIWLMHLSDDNSRENQFIQRVKRAVPRQVIVRACPK